MTDDRTADLQPSPLSSAISALQAGGYYVNFCEKPGFLTVEGSHLTADETLAFAREKVGWSGPPPAQRGG